MEIHDECYTCILRMLGTLADAALGEEGGRAFVAEIAAGEAFHGNSARLRSPIIVRDGWAELVRRAGAPDPLAGLKRRQNEAALALLPAARAAVAAADDPLAAAVVLAIVGNSLDVLVPGQQSAEGLMARLGSAQVDAHELAEFKGRVERARSIAYLGDNCGEAVFDRALIEVLTSRFDVEVTFVARALPALNDVTPAEARAVGLDEAARVIDNGIADALPGTLLALLGDDARVAVAEADLVISKGGGNLELLDDEPALAGRVTFLVDGKCVPLCREHGVPRGMPILRNA